MPHIALRLILATVLLATLPACATLEAGVPGAAARALAAGDVDTARDLTTADIALAHALAVQADDAAAMQCYPVLAECIGALAEARAAGQEGAAGLVTAYQRARNARLFLARDTPACGERLHVACAAMLDDSRGALRALLRRLAP